jgi:predicted lipoprotein with Yx(FWY)xxD motif
MTVYTYGKDSTNKSACYGRCAKIWRPLLGNESQLLAMHPKGKVANAFGLATRKDGTAQWTYDGHPLYLYSKDTQKGEQSGEGVRGTWHVAKATSD